MIQNPYQPPGVNDVPAEIAPDYTRLKRVLTGLSVLHAFWLVFLSIHFAPSLNSQEVFAIAWGLVAVVLGVTLAFRIRPTSAWRIAFPVWIAFAIFLPLDFIPTSSTGVWNPLALLAALVVLATVLVPSIERSHYTIFIHGRLPDLDAFDNTIPGDGG